MHLFGDDLPEGFFPGAPDLAVEVLSPDDRAAAVLAKVQSWLDAGSAAVWVVDPKTRTVSVYSKDGMYVYGADMAVPVPLFEGRISVGAIFAGCE